MPAGAEQSLEGIVAANYPPILTQLAAAHHHYIREVRQQAYATIDSHGSHYIVAAYSNSEIGAVLLLQKMTRGQYSVVDSASQTIEGSNPSIETTDLNLDGVPEAIVTYETYRGGALTWIYDIAGGKLAVISPVDEQGFTLLLRPNVVYVGPGRVDLVDVALDGHPPSPVEEHYVLRGGHYVATPPFDFFNLFFAGDRTTSTQIFAIADSLIAKSFELSMVNGGDCSATCCKASILTVSLNGVKLPAFDASMTNGIWSVPVELKLQNTITVEFGTSKHEANCVQQVLVVVSHK